MNTDNLEQILKLVSGSKLFELIGDGVSIQSPDFRIIYQNNAHKSFVGDHHGKYCYKAYEKRETVCEGCPVASSFRDGKSHTTVRSAPVDGKISYFEITASPILDSNGNIVAGIEIVRNITERKLAEDVIRESEAKFKAIFENATDGLLLADIETKKFILGNHVICELLGYEQNEIKSLGVMDIHPENDVPYIIEQFERQAKKEFGIARDIPVKRKDGSVFYADISSGPVMLGERACLIGIFRDLTERRETEKSMRRANRALTVLSYCNEAMVHEETENELLERVCRIIVENGGYRFAWIGYRQEDEEKNILPVAQWGFEQGYLDSANIVWADTERGQGPTGAAVRTGKPVISKDILNDPRFAPWRNEAVKRGFSSSAAIPLIMDNFTFGALNIYAEEPDSFDDDEITLLAQLAKNLSYGIETLRVRALQKTAEEYITRSYREWENIFQAIGHPTVILDSEHNIMAANRALLRVFKKPLDAISGKKCYEIFHGSGKPPDNCPMEKLFQSEKLETESMVMETLGGTYLVSCTPVLDDNGKLEKVIHIATDVTEQKKLEAQLLHSQKMESIGTLAGGVAHDFNNILTAIIGFTAILRKKIPDADPLRIYVDQIQKAANNAANLTNSLLTFSRRQGINPVLADINEIIGKFENFILRIIGEDIELRTILANEPLLVKVDLSQMEQVLMNLVSNARDAMPEGGILTIKTESVRIDDNFIKAYGYGIPGPYSIISISDTGKGMDTYTKERIFEPFFTTKEVDKGTGLGLSIVYGIIKQHNGYINVYSEPGSGSTFQVYLPLIKIRKISEDTTTDTPPPKGGKETILIAEDNEEVRDLLKTVLAEYGYNIIPAADGEDAVAKFTKNLNSIKLVVSDVIMPKKSGHALYNDIKKLSPAVRFLFISGYTAEMSGVEDVKDNGTSFITKPVEPYDLLRKIREILDGR